MSARATTIGIIGANGWFGRPAARPTRWPFGAQTDYMTGLPGSEPAFPALLADAMIRDAIDRGLDPDVARRAVVAGASQLDGLTPPSETVGTFTNYDGRRDPRNAWKRIP